MKQEDSDEVELHPLVNSKSSFDQSGFDESPRDSFDVEVPLPEDSSGPQRTERWTKVFVLALACTFSVGSHYSLNCIGPLKDILKQELSITDTQMSLVLGSNLVANTFVPIIAGVLVAKFGTLKSSLFATSILFLGQAINLFAVIHGSVPGMIFGLCLFGYASTLKPFLIIDLE
jgi:fucose permease